jgi:formylglycine-generating enzyme required for sulfatase activity
MNRSNPVMQKAANNQGLYDMAGNAAEWCNDWYGPYPTLPPNINPGGPNIGSERVLRGGSVYTPAQDLRAAARGKLSPELSNPIIGFRCAQTL